MQEYTDQPPIEHLGGPQTVADRSAALRERTDTVLIAEGEPEILGAGYHRELADVEKLAGSTKDEK